jgi:hypothetical protein
LEINLTNSQRNGRPQSWFSQWSREQKDLDSYQGYNNTDIDVVWIWQNVYSKPIYTMLIEEKLFVDTVTNRQKIAFGALVDLIPDNQQFKGYHLLQYKQGIIFLDDKKIAEDDLVLFLSFKQPDNWYKTYFGSNPQQPRDYSKTKITMLSSAFHSAGIPYIEVD